ncbi:MAG: hypothetical protein R3B89_16245 [Polyangiaceae bacterium]
MDWDAVTPTAVPGADGCKVSGKLSDVALSVDGEEAGTFLKIRGGAVGELILVPGGQSAARLAFGVARFDTGVSLDGTRFHLKQQPSPLGGVLYLSDSAEFSVSGGNSETLKLRHRSRWYHIRWVKEPEVEAPCAGLGWGRSRLPDWPVSKERLYSGQAAIPVRATPSSSVVAELTSEAGLDAVALASQSDLVKVQVTLSDGVLIGWTPRSAWTDRPSPVKRDPPGGSGFAIARPRRVNCAPGTPLLLEKRGRLYTVGRLRDTPRQPGERNADWRLRENGIRLELDWPQPVKARRWFVLQDDLRVTNMYWHDGLKGRFVVPSSADACSLAGQP